MGLKEQLGVKKLIINGNRKNLILSNSFRKNITINKKDINIPAIAAREKEKIIRIIIEKNVAHQNNLFFRLLVIKAIEHERGRNNNAVHPSVFGL